MTTTYTGVNGGGAYPNTITGPSAGEYVTAASVGIIAQGAANLAKRLYDMKVDRAGDTMTGKLVVTAAAASNHAGVDTRGDGGGPGISAQGGSGDGTGALVRGGSSNGNAVDALGAGVGTGVVATGGGSGGYGVYATGGTASSGVGGIGVRTAGGVGPGGTGRALEVGAGNAVFTGTSPAATADPGANNALSGANICKAWGMIEVAAGTVTLLDGYNIASVAIAGGGAFVLVTFARAFANADYAPVVSVCDAGVKELPRTGSHTTTTLQIHWINLASTPTVGMPIDADTFDVRHVSLHVFGRQ